jgi:hypothetical protein
MLIYTTIPLVIESALFQIYGTSPNFVTLKNKHALKQAQTLGTDNKHSLARTLAHDQVQY